MTEDVGRYVEQKIRAVRGLPRLAMYPPTRAPFEALAFAAVPLAVSATLLVEKPVDDDPFARLPLPAPD